MSELNNENAGDSELYQREDLLERILDATGRGDVEEIRLLRMEVEGLRDEYPEDTGLDAIATELSTLATALSTDDPEERADNDANW